MPLKTHEITIDGEAYRIRQIPWLDGVGVFRTLVRHAGEALIASVIKMPPEQLRKLAAGELPEVATQITTRVFGTMDDAALRSVITGLGAGIDARVGTSDAFVCVLATPDHFAGRYLHLLRVYHEAARVNFAGF